MNFLKKLVSKITGFRPPSHLSIKIPASYYKNLSKDEVILKAISNKLNCTCHILGEGHLQLNLNDKPYSYWYSTVQGSHGYSNKAFEIDKDISQELRYSETVVTRWLEIVYLGGELVG